METPQFSSSSRLVFRTLHHPSGGFRKASQLGKDEKCRLCALRLRGGKGITHQRQSLRDNELPCRRDAQRRHGVGFTDYTEPPIFVDVVDSACRILDPMNRYQDSLKVCWYMRAIASLFTCHTPHSSGFPCKVFRRHNRAVSRKECTDREQRGGWVCYGVHGEQTMYVCIQQSNKNTGIIQVIPPRYMYYNVLLHTHVIFVAHEIRWGCGERWMEKRKQ